MKLGMDRSDLLDPAADMCAPMPLRRRARPGNTSARNSKHGRPNPGDARDDSSNAVRTRAPLVRAALQREPLPIAGDCPEHCRAFSLENFAELRRNRGQDVHRTGSDLAEPSGAQSDQSAAI
jgi:hypothetical protein